MIIRMCRDSSSVYLFVNQKLNQLVHVAILTTAHAHVVVKWHRFLGLKINYLLGHVDRDILPLTSVEGSS